MICDVSEETQVASISKKTVSEFSRLDVAFNNVGIQIPASDFAESSAESVDRVTAINLRGVWACMKHELIQVYKQNSGANVNNSSVGGIRGGVQLATYHPTKYRVLENVVMDDKLCTINFADDRKTENTRAAYPLSKIAKAKPELVTKAPKVWCC